MNPPRAAGRGQQRGGRSGLPQLGSFECAPSQNGLLHDFLQPHHATLRAASSFSIFGTMPVPACEPSQYG